MGVKNHRFVINAPFSLSPRRNIFQPYSTVAVSAGGKVFRAIKQASRAIKQASTWTKAMRTADSQHNGKAATIRKLRNRQTSIAIDIAAPLETIWKLF